MTKRKDQPGTGGSLGALLREHRDDLLERWTRRVLTDPHVPDAKRLSEPELCDHIPHIIDELACVLEAAEESEASGRSLGSNQAAREHALHRAERGYDLASALREFSHFRAAVLDLCNAEGVELEGRPAQLVHATIDENMITGADEMDRAKHSERTRQGEDRERFIGILGHDLREPLATITLALAKLLEPGDTATESKRRTLRRALGSAERMARLIGDLLDFTRARAGSGIPIAPRAIDLREVCVRVIEEHQIAHPDRGIELDADGPVPGVWDPDRLQQVLANLLSNALEYGPPDEPVRVTLREEDDQAILAVHNDGPPIPAEALPRIFDAFQQGPQAGRASRRASLGLGLFITERIVEGHGGTIAVESTADEGTTFTVRLPRRPAS